VEESEEEEEEEEEEESSEEEAPKKPAKPLPGTNKAGVQPEKKPAQPPATKKPDPVKAQVPAVKKVVYTRAEKNLRLFYIRFAFIVIYFLGLKKLILMKKKKFYLEMNDTINKAFELGTEWALTFLESFLTGFWQVKDKYDWLSEDRLAEKEKT
jgi:hypothetical protein